MRILLLVALFSWSVPFSWTAIARAETRCPTTVTRAQLDESLALGTAFLLNNQQPAGHFHYAYDWRTKTDSADDSPVRQAGATWGLALILQDGGDVLPALNRALAFFDKHSRVNDRGARYVVYPGTRDGSLGTVALVALAHIERLRASGTPDAERRRRLDEYLKMVLSARRSEGGFHARYDHDDGKPSGAPSPYYDGEALLALVKAARYLGRHDLRRVVLEEADASHRRNVVDALADDPDSNTTKGYYQWASLSYYELATWRHTSAEAKHGDRLLALADWMIDVHQTLGRTRNTGYAYEGIIPAWVVARDRGDARAHRLDCVIGRGLGKLGSWQVGASTANRFITRAPPRGTRDRRAVGGVQNHARESLLRVDVTQHQMHAVILARRHWMAATVAAEAE